jgi:hypothetical protein
VCIERNPAAGQRARLDRREGERLNAPVDLHERLLQRFADLTRQQAGELLTALADRVCRSVENLRALVCGKSLTHRLRGRGDRPPRLVGSDDRNRGYCRSVPGRADDPRFVAAQRLAAHDQRLNGHRGFDLRHATSGSKSRRTAML